MSKKELVILPFFIFFVITICLYGFFADEQSKVNLNNISAKESLLNGNSIYGYETGYANKNLKTISSNSMDESQPEILEIDKLKVPGTIAMATSDSYPFKKNEVWNKSYIKEGESIKSYVLLANYKNKSHDFLVFNLVNYTQKPSSLGGNSSTTHHLTLEKDSYTVFTLETQPFEQVGEYLFQVVVVIDPYEAEPTGKYGFLDTGYLYLSPKVLVNVTKTGINKNYIYE
ncbi:hypothetical protein [Methanohalophilus portucalensis]|uniref:Uncharacterized protein n=2 Tax=Methanohalophilus portucalensis TaxID=39664 RepID=A0A1L9C5K8_9EURY|nr:hypothetical protein [Methanohalophilus portucalensis]ATU08466.1 hypothetical protein BKM01_06570 [Methanohalophilus portucalensis]OJH49815.1 hypothetical protein MPF_0603 [Methanohalophilus portucalensis FDF-1]RNI13366.1 hypothetical protein EFE41_01950 [Methanohalophilus portucalensis FDF-1]SMH33661.1 hypothetical protein SAMN06264941_0742 [Methanohalophilus portucalensis FDF-1]